MRKFAFLSLVGSAIVVVPAFAFDAGGFANRQHQHNLLRQQTAPNAPAPRANSHQREMQAEIRAIQAQHRRQLEPEYNRRVQREGRRASDRWLQQEAHRLGREAARHIQRKYGTN